MISSPAAAAQGRGCAAGLHTLGRTGADTLRHPQRGVAKPRFRVAGLERAQSQFATVAAQGMIVFVRRKTRFRGNIALRAFAFATGQLASLLLAIVTDAFRATRNGYR